MFDHLAILPSVIQANFQLLSGGKGRRLKWVLSSLINLFTKETNYACEPMGSLHRQVAVLVPDEKLNRFHSQGKEIFQNKTR